MHSDKIALRKELGIKLSRLDAVSLERQTVHVRNKLSDLLQTMNVRNIIAYRAHFTGEINVLPALESVISPSSIYIVSPKDREVSRDLKVLPVSENCEPILLTALGSVDAIIVPGLAFDRSCSRLGRGGGFYDRLLAQPTLAGTLKISVCLHDLIIDAIPTEPHDVSVDVVITDQDVYINQNSEQLKTIR